MTYRTCYEPRDWKELHALPEDVREVIDDAVLALSNDPRPSGCKKLEDSSANFYRIRIGNHRVVYVVEDEDLCVLPVRIGKRNEVYKKKR